MCEKSTLHCTDCTSCTHVGFVNYFATLSVSPTEKVAELSFVASLEDLGFVKTKEVIVSESLQVRCACLYTKGWTTLPVIDLPCFSLVL